MEVTLKISRVDGETTAKASADPPPDSADVWVWQWKMHGTSADTAKEISDNTNDTLADPDQYAGKEIRAGLKQGSNAEPVWSEWEELPAEQKPGKTEHAQLPWPRDFAGGLAVIIGVVTVVLGLAVRIGTRLRENTAQASTLEALPGQVTWPLLTIGWLVIATGIWMVVVEWRAGFLADPKKTPEPETKDAAEQLAKLVTALGNLKGATLVTLVGLVLLIAPVWIATSAAQNSSGGSDGASSTSPPGDNASTTNGDE